MRFCFVAALTTVFAGCAASPRSSTGSDGTPPSQQASCRGTAAAVVVTCGCNPVDSRLLARVDALKFNENIRLVVENCANGGATLGSSRGVVLGACMAEHTELDPKMRDALAQLISESDSSVEQKDKDAWNACYERVTQSAQPSNGVIRLSDQQFAFFAEQVSKGRTRLDAVYASCADGSKHTPALEAMREWELEVARALSAISPRLAFRFQADATPTALGASVSCSEERNLDAKYEHEIKNLRDIMNSAQDTSR